MSDPDAAEPPPPPQPPRPVRAVTGPTSTEEGQLEADERYARQLAEHYNGAAAYGKTRSSGEGARRAPGRGPARPTSGSRPNEYDGDDGPNWFDGM